MTAIDKGVLAVKMQENDAGAVTVRDYLIHLLEDVWMQGEGFDGKRPFGNSSWENEIYVALVRDGCVKGTLDGDGYLDTFDTGYADRLILSAIRSLQ